MEGHAKELFKCYDGIGSLRSIYKKLIGNGTQSKIIKGIFWSFLGTFISRGFILLAFVLIARVLSVEDYGKIGILKSYINTFTMLSLGSFGVTATKYLALYKDDHKRKAGEILSITRIFVFAISIVILFLSIFFSKSLTLYITGGITLQNEIILASIAIFFSSLNGLQVGALAGLEKFKGISVVNITNGLLSLPLLILGAKFYGVIGVIFSLAIVHFLIWLCSALLLQKAVSFNKIPFTLRGIKQQFNTIRDFSLPSFLSGLLVAPVVLLCDSLLAKYHPNGFRELGVYGAVFNFSIITITVINVMGQVFYPFAMKNFGNGNKKFEFLNIIHPYIIGIVIGIPIIFFADYFTSIFGKDYQNSESYITLIFVILSTITIAQRQGIARNFAAGNFMWWSLLSNFIWAFLVIGFSYIFIEHGAIGRALAFFLGYLINTAIFLPFYIKKKLITKNLIFNKYNLFIIVIIIFSCFSVFIIPEVVYRIFLIIIVMSLISLIFYKWWLESLKQ